VVRAGFDQGVVLVELLPWHRKRLNADKPADALAQSPHEGLALAQAVDRLELVHLLEVIARVEVREERSRLVPGRQRDLDDILHVLAPLGHAQILSVVKNLRATERRPRRGRH
jgi:hypothetical protein